MDLEAQKEVIKAIQTAPSDKELSEYLLKVSQTINPARYKASTISVYESMAEILNEKIQPFSLKLLDGMLASLTTFFFLTSGLHVIGAPSGHGKTFWAMQWAKSAALQGMNVLVLSLEMTHKDLSARTLCELSDFPLMKIIQRDFDANQKEILAYVINTEKAAYTKKIHVETFGDYDWVKIYPRLVDLMLRMRPKLIILDYIQMVTNSNDNDRTSKILGDIARELKLFADDSDSAAIVLSQINREAFREWKPQAIANAEYIPISHSYIKESGGIVEAADSVQMICIPSKIEGCPPSLHNKFQVSVQKSRRLGLHGTKLFPFDEERMKFV